MFTILGGTPLPDCSGQGAPASQSKRPDKGKSVLCAGMPAHYGGRLGWRASHHVSVCYCKGTMSISAQLPAASTLLLQPFNPWHSQSLSSGLRLTHRPERALAVHQSATHLLSNLACCRQLVAKSPCILPLQTTFPAAAVTWPTQLGLVDDVLPVQYLFSVFSVVSAMIGKSGSFGCLPGGTAQTAMAVQSVPHAAAQLQSHPPGYYDVQDSATVHTLLSPGERPLSGSSA